MFKLLPYLIIVIWAVGNIPYEATEEQLKAIFSQVGTVASFRLVYDRETGKPKGYGFCEYIDFETAQCAMRNLNNTDFNGRPLRVGVAAGDQTKEEVKVGPLVPGQTENPYGKAVNPSEAPEVISNIMANMPSEQMFELMKQMKQCINNNPNEARTMLMKSPQLAYALLQAQIIMRNVEPQVAMAMMHKKRDDVGAIYPTDAINANTAAINNANNIKPPTINTNFNNNNNVPNNNDSNAFIKYNNDQYNNYQPYTNTNNPPFSSYSSDNSKAFNQPTNVGNDEVEINASNPSKKPRLDDKFSRNAFNEQYPEMGSSRMKSGLLGDMPINQPPPSQTSNPPPQQVANQPPINQPNNRLPATSSMPDMSRANIKGPNDGNYGRQQQAPQQRQRQENVPRSRRGGDPRRMEPERGFYGNQPPARPPPTSQLPPNRQSQPPMQPPPRPPLSRRQDYNEMRNQSSNDNELTSNNAPPANGSISSTQDHEKAALIMQVLQLSDEQIAMLPTEQKQSILILKEQISKSSG